MSDEKSAIIDIDSKQHKNSRFFIDEKHINPKLIEALEKLPKEAEEQFKQKGRKLQGEELEEKSQVITNRGALPRYLIENNICPDYKSYVRRVASAGICAATSIVSFIATNIITNAISEGGPPNPFPEEGWGTPAIASIGAGLFSICCIQACLAMKNRGMRVPCPNDVCFYEEDVKVVDDPRMSKDSISFIRALPNIEANMIVANPNLVDQKLLNEIGSFLMTERKSKELCDKLLFNDESKDESKDEKANTSINALSEKGVEHYKKLSTLIEMASVIEQKENAKHK